MKLPDGNQSVALVLDSTAILAYVAGSMHVHEPMLLAGEQPGKISPYRCIA